ncbi:MAG: acyltransferase family protein [Lachnospiraceae bacterium]|nr:acyltransferase family protein [Lachnospiraceae bacterium]
MKTARIEWLDVAKGIGILLVVLAHCMDIEGIPFQLIYVFHMPMFFIFSGYLFKDKQGFNKAFSEKLRSLIVPYCMFFLLGLIVTMVIPVWRNSLTIAGLKNDLWLADPNSVHNSSIWFLVCMFFVQIIYWGINRMPASIQLIICFFLYTLGIIYSQARFPLFGYTRLPLNLDVVPIAIIFFAIGFRMRKYHLIETLMNNFEKNIIITIGGVIGLGVCYKINGYVNLHGLSFGNPIIYILSGAFGTAMVLGLSKMLEYFDCCMCKNIKNILIFYGQNTLMILGIQSLLIRLFILFCNFNGANLELYHMPIRYTIICSIIVIAICTIACIFWKQLKRKRDFYGKN